MLVLGFYESVTFAVIAAIGRPASFLGVLMSIQAAGSIIGGLAVRSLIRRAGEARTLGIALAAWAVASLIYTIPTEPGGILGDKISRLSRGPICCLADDRAARSDAVIEALELTL